MSPKLQQRNKDERGFDELFAESEYERELKKLKFEWELKKWNYEWERMKKERSTSNDD